VELYVHGSRPVISGVLQALGTLPISGTIGQVYDDWRRSIMQCLAHSEALIDFGEDEDDVTDDAYIAVIQS
ncbi:hypothetical protein B5M09_010708, partial [Aphanomyces astaci]